MDAVHEALGKTGEKPKKPKLHAHKIEYERAHNGGYHAHVHMHEKGAEHPHHIEHHVLPTRDDVHGHMDELMGDHPDYEGQEEPEEAEAGAPGGGAPPAGGPPAGGGAAPEPEMEQG